MASKSNTSVGIDVTVQGERAFRASLSEINAALRVNNAEIEAVSEAYKGNEKSIDALTAKQDALDRSILTQKERLEALESALKKTGEKYGETDTRTLRLRESLIKAQTQLEKTKREPRPKQFDEEVINIGRVTKVTKGGRHFRFSATVAVGDRKGRVGIGTGKANEVPDAIKKAVAAATKNVVTVSIVNGTIPHEAMGTTGASKILLKPACEGTGVKAGGAVRAVVELAGVKNILSKSLGSNTKVNMAYATLKALKSQKTVEQVAKLRGKTVKEIL